MSASPRFESPSSPSLDHPEALYFDSSGRCLFGFLYPRTTTARTGLGLVICRPFGFEAVCSHRALRRFAERAAGDGMPTLLFDYAGCGDSAEIELEADQIAVWTGDVAAAVEELRRQTSVERVCVLGFRLGALLAMNAAARGAAIEAMIHVAPVLSGRRYLRDLRTSQLAAALREGAPPDGRASEEDPPSVEAGIEVGGFQLRPASVATLMQTDLSEFQAAQVQRMLFMDRSDLPAGGAWSERLTGRGIPTRYRVQPQLIEMLMTEPHFAVVPAAAIAAVSEWLLEFAAEPAVRSAVRAPTFGRRSEGAGALLREREYLERPVRIGPAEALFGIITEPANLSAQARVFILLNSGATHHIGSSRLYTEAARAWARRGHLVLRLDLEGLGDSDTRAGAADDQIFPAGALPNIQSAQEFLLERYGQREVTLGGLCSAGYHALRAAVAGLPVSRVLLINPENFFWREGDSLEDLQIAEIIRNPGIYRRRVQSVSAWRRLLRGEVNLWRILRIYTQRPLLTINARIRDWARAISLPLPRDLGRELESVVARGVQILFVFGRGEPGEELLALQAGSSLKRLGDRCRIRLIDGADHTFTRAPARAALQQLLAEELLSVEAPDTSGAGG
jgi:pimeloyl-ACP methyl ester carboxylesterase